MEYRRLGNAGLRVSSVAFGGWINFGEGRVAGDIAQRVIETAYEQGINYFDLADIYGHGEAERQMGKVLKQYPRHAQVIASKVYWPMSDEVNDRGLSRKHILESAEKSLKRLEIEYLDLYFCHRPDPETPILETARAMDDLIHQGKVLYWGTSEWSSAQITEAFEVCERHGLYPPQVEQPNYSMLHREPVESAILPVTQPRGIGLVVFSPLAQGMLSGKYDEGIPEGTRFAQQAWARDRIVNERSREIVRRLAPVAAELGVTRAQLALAWVLRHPGVSSVITGATHPDQVQENVAAATLTLSDETLARIEAILSGSQV